MRLQTFTDEIGTLLTKYIHKTFNYVIWTLDDIITTFNEETWRDICTSFIELEVTLQTFVDEIKTLLIKYRTFIDVIWAFIDEMRASNNETRRQMYFHH